MKQSPAAIEDAALEAANEWVFEPGTLDGEAIDFLYIVRMDFTLG